jgi:hypothetical protein
VTTRAEQEPELGYFLALPVWSRGLHHKALIAFAHEALYSITSSAAARWNGKARRLNGKSFTLERRAM